MPGGLLLILLALTLVVAAGRAGAFDACFPPAGYIRSVQGEVEIRRAGGQCVPPPSMIRSVPVT